MTISFQSHRTKACSLSSRLRGGFVLFLVLSIVPALGQSADAPYRVTPVRPIEELRAEALKAEPPRETGSFRPSELVELTTLDPTIKLDIRYATTNNFLGTPVYSQARAFLQRPAAEALVCANHGLKAQGYGLLVHDGYRPWYVTKIFWDATPTDKKVFVADPADGSRHNRGCAVDLTLYDLKTGKPVEMPSLYDEMTERAYSDYQGGTAEENQRRAILRHAMEDQGFTVLPEEWWHFDYKDWRLYPILNLKFEDLKWLGESDSRASVLATCTAEGRDGASRSHGRVHATTDRYPH